jgi:hypothetical protein
MPANPIGLKYPGTTITHEENWVGVITTKANNSLLLTWDYAISGQQVTGVVKQIEQQFVPTAGTRPDYCSWTASNSLFGKSQVATWYSRLFIKTQHSQQHGSESMISSAYMPSIQGSFRTDLKNRWGYLAEAL